MRTARVTASQAVRDEWLRRIEAEYRSAAHAQHLGLWLMQLAAPPDRLEACQRIARDELAHADHSHRTYVAAGGTGVPQLAPASLELRRHLADPLEWDVTRVCLEGYCLGETVAVPLFSRLRAGCTAPLARRTLDRILRDEVRHRAFGWATLRWLLTAHAAGDELRALVERELPAALARVCATYAPEGANPSARANASENPNARANASENPNEALPAADRAWGLMPSTSYAAVLHRTLERDWPRRFGALGLGDAFTRATSARPSRR